MNGYIINTHPVWFANFVIKEKAHDQIVFWNKSARLPADAITKGTFLFHRLTGTKKIEGISVVSQIETLPLGEAWKKYQTSLGYESMEKLIDVSARMEGGTNLSGGESPILCIVLTGLFLCSLDITIDLPKLGIFFGTYPNLPTVGKLLSEMDTKKLLSRAAYQTSIYPDEMKQQEILKVTKNDINENAVSANEVLMATTVGDAPPAQQLGSSFEDKVRTLVESFKKSIPELQAKGYHIENEYWHKASQAFKTFWTGKIVGRKLKPGQDGELDDIDPIIRLLDANGRRSYEKPPGGGETEHFIQRVRESGDQYGLSYNITSDHGKLKIIGLEGVAKTMVTQQDWYAIFRELFANTALSQSLNEVFIATSVEAKVTAIDKLTQADRKSIIVKQKAVPLSAMLSLFDPMQYVQTVSLGQRKQIIEAFGLGRVDDRTYGSQVISTYELINRFNERFTTDLSTIQLSYFLYTKEGKTLWQTKDTEEPDASKNVAEKSIDTSLERPEESTILPLKLEPAMVNSTLSLPKELVSQMCSILNSRSHAIITGPVGTGKTTFAEEICKASQKNNFCNGYVLTTASSDWTTFDTIGGYMPTEQNKLRFEEGKFLEAIRQNKWLIIDEINRADIDKAFGQLFTVLSGQSVELPFKNTSGKSVSVNSTLDDRSFYDEATAAYKVGKNWRIIATMNIYDMNFLFEMSYAFMRRFAFIYMGLPENIDGVIKDWCVSRGLSEKTAMKLFALTSLAGRKFGPAITKDIVDYLQLRGDGENEIAEAIIGYVLPQLEGLDKDKIQVAWEQIVHIFEDSSIPSNKILPILQELTGIDLTPAK
jgi:MoxR-like ATPase